MKIAPNGDPEHQNFDILRLVQDGVDTMENCPGCSHYTKTLGIFVGTPSKSAQLQAEEWMQAHPLRTYTVKEYESGEWKDVQYPQCRLLRDNVL